MRILSSSFLLFYLSLHVVCGQPIHHWEAAVLAENLWSYHIGNTEPPDDWYEPGFDDSAWSVGPGGIGYSDGDDNTIIEPTISLYLRKDFGITDTATIAAVSLYADYDDAFVAYLNGVEIARANIGTIGVVPAYNETSILHHEAQLYQGGQPDAFPIQKQQLDSLWHDGTNTLAIQVHNKGLGSSDLSSLFFLMIGIIDSSNDYQPLPDWFPEPFISSNLPLLFINTNGIDIPDEPKLDAYLGIVDNGPDNLNFLTDSFNGYDGYIGIELRGSSSLSFAKKNYGLETRYENGENNNVPLLGMPEENDWVLHGPYSDKSLMRNVLSFHIGELMERYTPRTRWCELFINDQYMGVYVLMEKIKRDKNRVNIAKLKPEDTSGDELTGGYIFSADRSDEGPETGWASPFTNAVFYKYQDPDFDELMPVQKDYISNYFTLFETDMNGASSAEKYEQYIDVPSWIDYWIATEVFKHIDNYKYSFYMYKRKESNGGKIHFGPLWDLNLGYGNFNFAQDPGPEGWSFVWANLGYLRPGWILDLSTDSKIQNRAHCRWKELRQGGLHTDSLMQFIDSTAYLLEQAQNRNFERWPVLGTYLWPNSYVGDSYEEEVNFLKDWLTARLDWMDENMEGDCALVSTENEHAESSVLKIFPNPFHNELVFHLNAANNEKARLTLFDVLGKPLLEEELECRQLRVLSLQDLTSGIYFYQLKVDEQVLESGKIIKD
jgi:hypothetical protein